MTGKRPCDCHRCKTDPLLLTEAGDHKYIPESSGGDRLTPALQHQPPGDASMNWFRRRTVAVEVILPNGKVAVFDLDRKRPRLWVGTGPDGDWRVGDIPSALGELLSDEQIIQALMGPAHRPTGPLADGSDTAGKATG